ncbi:MAG: FecCD family ABC transporter permease [Pseudomonadota bacterium]
MTAAALPVAARLAGALGRRRRRRRAMVALVLVGLLLAVLFGLGAGAVAVPPLAVVEALLGTGSDPVAASVVLDLRLPRILTGLLVGAALAVAGAAMQGLFRNPLADPGLVGVSSGAALGAVVVIVALGEAWAPLRPLLLPFAAFTGALIATLVVQRLATYEGRTTTALLLLAGIAINSIVGAALGLAAFFSTDQQLRDLTFWTLGSLAGTDPRALWPAAILMALAILGLPLLARVLDACLLGEREAGHLGIDVERSKLVLIALVALGTGAAVAACGIIGFVGLVVPHLARLLVGADHRWLMPVSAILGAALLLTADIGARLLVLPAELPIGILTTALGGPFFLALLLANRRRFTV